MSSTSDLPLSARLSLWFTAWVDGRVSLDDARDAVVAEDTAHDVAGLPGSEGLVPLIVAFGRLRGSGATGAGLALPVPGDPLGLAGPRDFNAAALEAGEGVVLSGTVSGTLSGALSGAVGLVPTRAGSGVVWVTHPADPYRQVPDPHEADTTLRRAVLDAANTLASLDIARWRPEVADELMSLRRDVDLDLPPQTEPRTVRLASLSLRCRGIVDLALDDDGGAVSASEADRRRAALTPLDHAARRGLVAACSGQGDR